MASAASPGAATPAQPGSGQQSATEAITVCPTTFLLPTAFPGESVRVSAESESIVSCGARQRTRSFDKQFSNLFRWLDCRDQGST